MARKLAPFSVPEGMRIRLPTTSIWEDHDATVSPGAKATMATPLTPIASAWAFMAARAALATEPNSEEAEDGDSSAARENEVKLATARQAARSLAMGRWMGFMAPASLCRRTVGPSS